MRILHITRRYAPMRGGIERYVQSVAEGQAAIGHDVTVLTLDRDVIGDVPGRLPARRILSTSASCACRASAIDASA